MVGILFSYTYIYIYIYATAPFGDLKCVMLSPEYLLLSPERLVSEKSFWVSVLGAGEMQQDRNLF